MKCKKCKNELVAKGIKQIICIICHRRKVVNTKNSDKICVDCSDEVEFCEVCGINTRCDEKEACL